LVDTAYLTLSAPEHTESGNNIIQIRLSLSGNLVFRVASHDYDFDEFTTLEIIGVGALLTANADFTLLATDSRWVWSNTGFTLNDGQVHFVEFN